MSPVVQMLERELATYAEQKERLLAEGEGKYVLIKNAEVAGVFESEADAISEGYMRFGNVPFLVKQIAAVDLPLNFTSSLLAV